MTDLGSLVSGASSAPNAINTRGVVAGISENGAVDPTSDFPPEFRAVVWKHGQVIDLGTLGGTFSYASDINDSNQVVGFSLNVTPEPYLLAECGGGLLAPTQIRAFVWEGNGLHELGTLGGPDSCAMYINAQGQIAGNSFTNSTPNPSTGIPTQDPFFWKNGAMTDLGGLGGTLGHVSAMNDHGQICGDSNLAGDDPAHQHGFFWDRGTMTDLTPGFSFSVAESINDRGDVVGGAFTADEQVFEGYLWRRGALTVLPGLPADGCSTAAFVNAKGQAVGSSFPCDGDSDRAVLWDRPGAAAIDLNTVIPSGSGLTLAEATSINDAGEITGRAVLANGDEHAFLLIPRGGRGRDDGAVTSVAADVASRNLAARGGLTPERKAALRGLAHRHRAFGRRSSR